MIQLYSDKDGWGTNNSRQQNANHELMYIFRALDEQMPFFPRICFFFVQKKNSIRNIQGKEMKYITYSLTHSCFTSQPALQHYCHGNNRKAVTEMIRLQKSVSLFLMSLSLTSNKQTSAKIKHFHNMSCFSHRLRLLHACKEIKNLSMSLRNMKKTK